MSGSGTGFVQRDVADVDTLFIHRKQNRIEVRT